MMKKHDNRKQQILLSVVIAFIMVSSVIGFMFGREEQNTVEYNKIKFYQKNFLWATKINGQEVVFHNFPTAVEYLNISDDIYTKIKSTLEIDSTYDQNNSYVEEIAGIQYELEMVLNNFFNIYLRKGLTDENKYNLPMITCDDATPVVPVLYFKTGNRTEVYLENNCIIAEAKNGVDLLKIKDRIILGLLGIME